MKRIDDLQYENLILVQDTDLPRFTGDAVLLANFLRLGASDRALDLGCGTGLIPVLASKKTGASFSGIDCQPELIALAEESVRRNEQSVSFYTMDLSDAPSFFGHGSFTAVTANPPWFSGGTVAENPSRALTRHASDDTLDVFLSSTSLLLKNGGRFFICYPASLIAPLMSSLRAYRLEPKRLCLFPSSQGPRVALLEAKKGAAPGLLFVSETNRQAGLTE